jgi:hypothetical protein
MTQERDKPEKSLISINGTAGDIISGGQNPTASLGRPTSAGRMNLQKY